MPTPELKSCPFCASLSLDVWNCRTPTRGPAFYAVCRNIICAANGPSRATEAEAIAAWNTRAIEATRPTDMEIRDAE